MAQPSRGTTKNASQQTNAVRRTSGEIFNDGSMIELVRSASNRRLDLLLWHRNLKKISAQLHFRGRVYEAPDIDETLLQAIPFPSDAVPYGAASRLLSEVCEIFARYVGLPPPEASLVTAWSCSTWFAEFFSSPPPLVISGPDMSHAITLLRLLACVSRRPLLLADVDRAGLLAVMNVQPTLLVNQPGESPALWKLLDNSNFQGVSVLKQGRVHNLSGPRAIFVGMENAGGNGAIHLILPPSQHELVTLDAHRQAEIAEYFHPRLLMYRLRNFRSVCKSQSTAPTQNSPHTPAMHTLAACIQGDRGIAQAIAPILRRQDQDAHIQRGCDIARIVVEVVWVTLHDITEVLIGKIAELANALLRSRGERLEYSAMEVGWQLRSLGSSRDRNGSGRVLPPSQENLILCHQWARRFGLDLSPVPRCPHCLVEVVVPAEV